METPEDRMGLTDLPNIGQEVARLLVAAGIRSPQALQRCGAVAAAVRIAGIRPADPPCRSMLAGLEGAIRGVRWHSIPKVEREALWQDYQARSTGGRLARPAEGPTVLTAVFSNRKRKADAAKGGVRRDLCVQ